MKIQNWKMKDSPCMRAQRSKWFSISSLNAWRVTTMLWAAGSFISLSTWLFSTNPTPMPWCFKTSLGNVSFMSFLSNMRRWMMMTSTLLFWKHRLALAGTANLTIILISLIKILIKWNPTWRVKLRFKSINRGIQSTQVRAPYRTLANTRGFRFTMGTQMKRRLCPLNFQKRMPIISLSRPTFVHLKKTSLI